MLLRLTDRILNRMILGVLLLLSPAFTQAQTAESTFHLASGQYIHNKKAEAKTTLDQGLRKYPNDAKLKALRDKIKDEEQKNQQDQKNDEQQNKDQKEQQDQKDQKDQQKKDEQNKQDEQQKKEQEKKDQQEKKQQEQKEAENQKQEKEEKQKPDNLDREKLEQMKISEEKARMILEAMKNQEKQYLQQQRRKATKSRQKDKPDW